jgi:hypothetical protein
MSGKIKIKYGHIEVECEGTEEFLKKELPDLLKTISELAQNAMPLNISSLQPQLSNEVLSAKQTNNYSVSTIAQKLSAKKGPALIIAACLKLKLSDMKESYNKNEILTEMRTAKSFYKSSYAKNIGVYLTTLIKNGKLHHNRNDDYSLSEQTLTELRNLFDSP